ncbi:MULTISPECIES: LysR family transcriptional regulator [Streptomyces]|uniref:LysR family transcriptional regulator n=2 Tax=Streptomyces TaxID=1883 RepID=A0ABV9J7H6_9ACTN
MDVNKLRHAVTVAREGSFVAAAEVLHLSQSALTRSIQALENHYGLTVFERGRNGARLTPEGEAFIAAAEDIVWSVKRADQRLLSIGAGRNATVRFGAGPVVTASVLPEVMSQLSGLPVDLDIRIGSNATLRSLLSRGEIDFFVGGVPARSDHFRTAYGFRVEQILKDNDDIWLVVHADHPLASGDLTPDRLSRYPVACESFVKDRIGLETLAELGLRPPSIEIDDYGVLHILARTTDHILVSSWGGTGPHGDDRLVRRRVAFPDHLQAWTWGVVSSNRAPLTAPIRAVVDVLLSGLPTPGTPRTDSR